MDPSFKAASQTAIRSFVNDETYLLIVFILLGGTLIVSCACYSLRITRLRMIECANKGVRRSHIQSYIDEDDEPSSRRVSCGESDLSAPSSGNYYHGTAV